MGSHRSVRGPDGEIRVSEADQTLSIEVPGKKVELSFSVSTFFHP